MNEAQLMIKEYKEETRQEYKSFAAHCSPKYVEAVAKQSAQRKLKALIKNFNKERFNEEAN